MAVWGHPRFTADIDIVIELELQKLDQLAAALLKIDRGVYIDREAVEEALKHQGKFNLIHPSTGLKVDFWILKDEPFDRERMRRRVRKKFNGTDIFFTSSEDLILIKLLWHKEGQSIRHLEDIESIMRIQRKLDWHYLKKWAKIHSTSKTLLILQEKFTSKNRVKFGQ